MKLFKCKKCGKVIEIINEGANNTICCDEQMIEIVPNKSDGAKEKHVPYISIDGCNVNVKIGETCHPMNEEHYIEWIACCYDDLVVKKYLKPQDKPEAVFEYRDNMKIYSYCNLHGLWVLEDI